jgi:hypothetical protein
MSSRIKTSFQLKEPMPTNMPADFEWVKKNRDSLFEKYGSCVLVVYEQKVLGVGETYSEAIANAETNLPESPEIITPVVKVLSHNSFRLRSVRTKNTGD